MAERCQETIVDPTDSIGRASWCELPDGHAGRHHAEIPQPGHPPATLDWEAATPDSALIAIRGQLWRDVNDPWLSR